MPFAVETYFDSRADARIRDVWRLLSERGISSHMPDMGATPHISLAVFQELEIDGFLPGLHAFAASHRPLSLIFHAVRVFPTAEGVVYLAPALTPRLLQLHAEFHATLDSLGLRSSPLYRPDAWVPHCTLAMQVSPGSIGAAVEIAQQAGFGPAQLQEIGVVEFPPVRPIRRHPLAG